MSYDPDPTTRLASCRTDFDALGIKWAKPVTAAFALVDRIRADTPTAPDDNAARDLILDGAPAEQITAALVVDTIADRLRSAHNTALSTASARAQNEITAVAADLVEQMRPQAEALIARLRHVAELDTRDVHQLLQAGRQDDATAVAAVEGTAVELRNLIGVRNRYLWVHDVHKVDGIDSGLWADERPVQAGLDTVQPTAGNIFVMGLKRGGIMRWPTLDEARRDALAIAGERRIDLEQGLIRDRQLGRLGAVMA